MGDDPETDRIRVLYLLDDLSTVRAGTEQHLHWLLGALPEEIDRRFVILSRISCPTSEWPVVPVCLSERFGSGPGNWHRRLLEVARIIRSEKIHVLHAMCPMSESVAFMTRVLGCKAGLVGSRRDTGYNLTRFRSLRTRMLQGFDIRYVANSEAARVTATRREGIPGNRIVVIPNPVVESRIKDGFASSGPRSKLADDGTLIVAMVATVRPVKDHATLVRAARIITDSMPDVRFYAFGEQRKEELASLIKLTDDLGLSGRFLWPGPVDNPYSVLRHVDVAVLSSRSESFSNSVLEYAAAGCPSVVTDVGSLRDIVVDGVTGFVVPPGCPEELAGRLLTLLADPALRRRFGSAARAHVMSRYSQESVLAEYLRLYKSLARTAHQRTVSTCGKDTQ